MKLLVTGGAGYIGSVVAALLLAEGHEVTVLDDESTGHPDAVPAGATYVRGTIREHARAVLADGVNAVLHFAAKSLVAESVARPSLYWRHNLGGTLALLEAMRATRTARIVFSSTAAVYGEPERVPIDESAPPRPTSPYGATKLATDTALAEHARMHQIGAVSLRYFNVAGAYADAGGRWYGERHDPETHLIPSILSAALSGAGKQARVEIFGDDYPTPDGTCIRDYIHVNDLAQAHILSVEYLLNGGASEQFNVGTGTGHSVLEMIRAVEEVTGRKVPYVVGPRREGDPSALVAASEKLRTRLGWTPRHTDLRTIVDHAWKFAASR
jgi:UDP-glucose 4-epimerase